jgi:hypothetical protein
MMSDCQTHMATAEGRTERNIKLGFCEKQWEEKERRRLGIRRRRRRKKKRSADVDVVSGGDRN